MWIFRLIRPPFDLGVQSYRAFEIRDEFGFKRHNWSDWER
jgi:hypothetical protein